MSAADLAAHRQEPLRNPHSPGLSDTVASPAPAEKVVRRRYPLAIVLAIVCLGMVADRQAWWLAPRSLELLWCVSMAALGSWYALWRNQHLLPAMAALSVALAAAGGAWHHARWNLFADDDLGRFALGSQPPICLEAIALSAPREVPSAPFTPLQPLRPEEQCRFVVQPTAVRDRETWQSASGRAQVMVAGKLDGIHAGDRLQIFGHFYAPEPAGNPGEFDYALHDRGNRELSVVRVKRPACVTVVQSGSSWNPWRWIDDLRQRGNALLSRYISPERAGLAAAVLLGQREQVDRETSEAFLEAGTIHVLCVSGLHVGILAWLLFWALRSGWMPRRTALVCVIAITGAYMLLTDAQPPVIRATLLVWIVCGAMWLGRRGIGLNSLALTGLIVLAVNPAGLFRTGVQLSFLSVAVLMAVAAGLVRRSPTDPLDRLIAAARPWPQRTLRKTGVYFVDIIIAGAAVWLAVTPLTMAQFHVFSPVALALNVLMIPFVTLAMAAGLAVLALGWWLPPLGAACGWFCDWNLNVLDHAVKAADRIPGGHWWVVGPAQWWLAVFYLALAAMIFVPRWLPSMRWRVALLAGWCGIGLIVALPATPTGDTLKCTFIDVGHGGGELLELPDGRTLLYDAGRLGSPWGAARSISAYLWSRGITHLDAVVISHSDTDHYNALPELLKRFSVGVVYVSPVMFKKQVGGLKVLRDCIEQSGTRLETIWAGDRLRVGEPAKIEVLHPPPKGVVGRDNANCIVLAIEFAGKHILLTGDLEPPGLEEVTNEAPFACDVLQIPHHGSGNSEPHEFANWTRPKWAFIAGANTDGLISTPIYESHGAAVLNTAQCGAITATIDSAGVKVDCFRPTTLIGRPR